MAKFVEWSEDLNVGIEEIDDQHKVETGKTSIGLEPMHFFKVRLTKHIMESDMNYSDFFLKAGTEPKLKKKSWTSRLWGGTHG